jgi:outer membrane protein assembly factor BamB
MAGAGAVPGQTGAFNGELHQIRVWGAARTTAQVSAFRYVPLAGPESDLRVLIGFAGSNPANPGTQHMVNLAASDGPVAPQGNPAPVIPVQLPRQPLPTNVWTYPTQGESPVGPSLSPQGALCIENTSSDSYLRCVDLETGQVSWTYDPAVAEGGNWPTSIIPWAVGLSGQTVYLGVQQKVAVAPSIYTVTEIHAVDVTTGRLIGALPSEVMGASQFLTRPVVLNGTLYVGYISGKQSSTGLAWGAVNDRYTNLTTYYFAKGVANAMTTPVTDGTNVYIATTQGTSSTISAIPADTPTWGRYAWQKTPTPPAAVTAGLVLGGTTLFVAMGGTIMALNTANGATVWSHPLSSSPVKSTPVLLGSTLYVGSTDGVLYALDAATGQEQWRVDTGSAITTDLVNEFGVLYFANAGSGTAAGPAPAFVAVDTNSLGNDVLTYPVPGADTILFDQAGVTNGVAYFYGSQNVYAVNMANVLHEFSVNSKLIVEDYDTTGSAPVGNNTSYRVTLTIRDQNGMPRVNQAVKLWSADDLYVVNQGATVTLTPDQPVWMQTDSSGNLTLALSAFDDGTPAGSPNVACPALFAWSNFMPAEEAIVIYPDHESLTSLSTVQGSTSTSTLGQVRGGSPAPLTLDQATGYDGQPLILSSYQDADSLTAIAATVRNTVGTRNPATVGARHLGSQRYVKAGVIPNVLHVTDTAVSPTRPYVPGADSIFTMDLSSGTPVFTAGTYDPSRPSGYQPTEETALGSVFTDIRHFTSNVVKGAEKVGKMAWKFTENAVTTVIHTAENEYQLVITDLEDAVTAVTGFLKSVVADIKKVIQWLSALFRWENILKNHAYIKNSISNPTDPAHPGILDRLLTWTSGELSGGSDFTSVLSQLSGHSSAAAGSTAQVTTGQTVQSQQGGNNDPNAVYNTGGNNNANQCTWMHQKVNENSAGGSVGSSSAGALGASWDPGPITQAFENFLTAADAALEQDFADLPGQIKQALESVLDSFKDPKTLLSTAVSDLITVFQDLADDFVKFAQDLATDFLKLIAALLEQVVIWLTEPISIPFVSELYHALTGDPLSVLDLACLLAAVPGTILLAVITGSPTVPDTVSAAPEGALPSGELAGRILLGITAYCLGEVGVVMDIMLMDFSASMPSWYTKMPANAKPDPFMTFLNYLDFAVDFTSYALQMVTAWGWSAWQGQDWAFWIYQSIPQAFNFVYLFRSDGTGELQATRDVLSGVVFLVVSSVYAHFWPSSYKDAPKAPGLVLSANVFGNTSLISEILMLLLNPWDWGMVEAVVKVALFTVSNILAFTANVLGLANS